MTRRLALRRFRSEVVRRRQGPGGFSDYGEFEPGAVVTTVLPALIQPLKLEDSDFAGGVSLVDRVKVYCPTGIERVVGPGDTLTWSGEALRWNGEPLTWGGTIGYRRGDENPLAAAFDDRGADAVQIGSIIYIVEESELWASHCRAVLLRET